MMTREEKAADRTRVLADKTELYTKQSTAARVYYVIAGSQYTPFDRNPKDQESLRQFQITTCTSHMLSTSAHRTRKALAVILDKLVARAVLTGEDVDDILLAAVEYLEPDPRHAGR